MSEMLSRVAHEVDILQAIDAIDDTKYDKKTPVSQETALFHTYYVSASPDNHREVTHVHEILARKNRKFARELPAQNNLQKTSFSQHHSDTTHLSCEPLTVIVLWGDFYQNDSKCLHELQHIINLYQKTSDQIRIVFLLLNPNLEIPDHIPEKYICTPGFDRVSRELAIFKLVEEEHF
ncbi:MAG: hypothetical protein HQK75_04080 [Candidatus Magnetomorum sp.]|nr:hypothetical protein [Candidatus Magnetomorum sp.]